MKNSILPWILAIRPKTLPAAICPVLVGSSLAIQGNKFNALPSFLCLLFALLIQVGTNFANDYYDFIKGADTEDRQGPKRVTASGLISLRKMKIMTAVIFFTAFWVGVCLIPYGGWWLLFVGIISIMLGYGYTAGPFPLAYLGLGEIFVMFFFGWIAVGCTYFVQSGSFGFNALVAGTAVGSLSTNLLVINNHRDVETDIKANKKTLAVRFGRKFSAYEYCGWFSLALICIFILAITLRSFWILLPVFVTPLAFKLCSMIKKDQTGPVYVSMLGKTSIVMVTYCILLSLGLSIS